MEKTYTCRQFPESPDDEIVITGLSGRFPNSHNVTELANNLYNKIDCVDDSERRWKHTHPSIPKRHGKVYDIEKFDATFFGVHYKQANTMDPACRMLLEHSYEAILDSGYCPQEIRGTRTGVFSAVCITETERDTNGGICFEGYTIIGCNRGMMANRLSYMLDVRGPSFVLDSACSSSLMALDAAYTAIRNGECDAALVCGANLTLDPLTSMQFAKLGVLAMDGYCRPFDHHATGYTRSEAICCIFVQKRKDARRCYATLVHSKINCDGYKDEGITYPSGELQTQLLTEFYKEIHLNPNIVDYVEAHGTGTPVGDPEECAAIGNIFCQGRTKALPIGSIKSNIGHTEPVSGLCSVTKVLIAYETGLIPPNINITKTRESIAALNDGRLKVITEPTPLDGPLSACSSFGFGGSNGHVLLRANNRVKKNQGIPADGLPRLVCWAGRTEEACDTIFQEIIKKPLDAEFVHLLQKTQSKNVSANNCRGYAIFQQEDGQPTAKMVSKEVEFMNAKMPLVWVFSGMGSQWVTCGRSLMQLPLFRESIEKTHKILTAKGLDLIKIITSEDPTMFDNILHSFVGIASIQIGLVDVLRALGLEPDFLIGHSVGELGCGYADGCFTAEEMVLCAYSRGMASLETKVIKGSMAAVGLSYAQILPLMPKGVEVACHNGIDSCTISGPAELVAAFVETLKGKDIFAREVPCSNIPYHSSYIAEMGPKLFARLSEVIKNPKRRSAKWLSTSVPKQNWDKEENCFCSPRYQTNNLLNSVLFEETLVYLPENSVTIEISPHSLLQAILRKSMPIAQHISLTKRGSSDSVSIFLTGIGKLFLRGKDLPIEKLYPAVQYPVSVGTPMIAPLMKWNHADDWYVAKLGSADKSGERNFRVNFSIEEYAYVTGHMIDGRVLFPATGYLNLVWETFAGMAGQIMEDCPVEFVDVKFVRATALLKDTNTNLLVIIQRGSGKFEISESNATVVTGTIRQPEKMQFINFKPHTHDVTILKTADFYKELKLRGYLYNGEFRSVLEARSDGFGAKIKWNDNFVSFMDCLMQTVIVGNDSRALALPVGLDYVRIDPKKFMESIVETEDGKYVIAEGSSALQVIRAGGIEIQGPKVNAVERRKPPGDPVLETYKFIPYYPRNSLEICDAVRSIVQIGLENGSSLKVKAVETEGKNQELILTAIQDALNDLPLITSDLILLTETDEIPDEERDLPGITVEKGAISGQKECLFVIGSKYCADLQALGKISESCMKNGYIISRESNPFDVLSFESSEFKIVSAIPTGSETLVMIKCKMATEPKTSVVHVSLNDTKYTWIDKVKAEAASGRVYLVAQGEPLNGMIGLVNCLRKEPKLDVICVFIDDPKAPGFDLNCSLYQEQLSKGMAINVYRNGEWGSYRHLSLLKEIIPQPRSTHYYANALNKGDLSSLTWIQGELDINDPKKDIVRVQYSALNFRDVMVASGKLNFSQLENSRIGTECDLGLEFSGVNRKGERVMGMVRNGSMATHVEALKYITWKVPSSWSLEEAATVPVVYSTVYYSFFVPLTIQKGKKILIHAGTGGIGLSAIRVALAYGLEVFTTVSTAEKKRYLMEQFPQVPESHIGSSRDNSFYEMIMNETDGAGVDYVLNSLSEEKLLVSIKCLGTDGSFLEIGKFDMMNDSKIGLGHFINGCKFYPIMVDQLMKKGTVEDRKIIHDMIQKDIDRGIIVPLKPNVFNGTEIEQAFRFLASAKHMGKVLLKIREKSDDVESMPLNAIPRTYFNPSLTYIILGGLGGFGMELADWMVLRGCRKLMLSSSRGISKTYQEYRINLWKSYGVNVAVCTADITSPSGCLDLIKEATKISPVGGIFNLAVRLRDNIFENQDAEKYNECIAVKAHATKYLDELSRRLCPQLKHFVVFSSVSCGRGNAGQSNYGMANSIMERIIEQRQLRGLPGKAIQWGAIGEVGLVADMAENKIDMEIGGTLQQRISSCLHVFDMLMGCPDPIVGSMVVAEKKIRKGATIIDTVMNIMGLRDSKSLSMDVKLSEMGMDSLMAVEIKQTLERDYEMFLSPQDLRSLTFQKLQDFAKQKSSEINTTAKDAAVKGIGFVFNYFSSETMAQDCLVPVQNQYMTDQITKSVLIFPGIEGTLGKVFVNLADSIKCPSFCCQHLIKSPGVDNINELTDKIFDEIYEKLYRGRKQFYLIGYSFGGLVTMDIAYRLEQKGLTGKVLLVDSGVQLMRNIALNLVPPETPNADELLRFMLLRQVSINALGRTLSPEIEAAPTWDEKIRLLSELGAGFFSPSFVRLTIDVMVNTLSMASKLNEHSLKQIKSDIVLVRPTEVAVLELDEDYQMSKYTTGTVKCHVLEGDHTTLLYNPELANIINEASPYEA